MDNNMNNMKLMRNMGHKKTKSNAVSKRSVHK